MTPLQAVLEQISGGAKRVELSGLRGSSPAWLLSRLIQEGPGRTWLFLGKNGKEASLLQRDLEFYLGPFAKGEVLLFPPHDVLPFTNLSPHNDITCMRLATLHALTQRTPPAFVATTVTALLPYLPPPDEMKSPILLKAGQETDREKFLKRVAEWGYQNVPLVLDRGNIAVRGGLVDLFAPADPQPVRLEWIGDRIESIRRFDPSTQRSLSPVESVTIVPAREVTLSEKTIETFAKKARRLGEEKGLGRNLWAPLIEKVRNRIPFPGIETCLPLFYDDPTTLIDWLPPNTTLIAEDLKTLAPLIRSHLEEVETLTRGKEFLLNPGEVLLPAERFADKLSGFGSLSFSPFTTPSSIFFGTESHEGIRKEIESSRNSLEPLRSLVSRLNDWLSTDVVTLVASSEAQRGRLSDLLTPHLKNLPPIVIGDLSSGFRLPSGKIVFLTEEEIFGQKVRRDRSRLASAEQKFSSFAELKIGDPIVHKDHGIGLYRGLIPMEIEGCQNDFLLIEYRDGDKLYLPVTRMNLVQRYTGSDGASPRIDKLGGSAWQKVRSRSEKAIRALAGDLLNLYAARSLGHGFAFSPPNELFEAFEAGFPFEETPDQGHAIEEVLKDMQKGQPMDRLVLGDVGYGKTEVALRAAFKAALDGKQTAFLVPTTLLAFQHYERFRERFRDYPVTIEMLSRFRTASEQKKIVQDLNTGKIDIIIGTHRLIQPDISFKDLGLIVIDEEHRFGVTHKERLKRLRKNCDVLAMSATPIPRTLYMSLVGIRGISVIETPPTDRLAIRTFVMPFEESVIREAILKERQRGGQIYFVHNEIGTIGRMKGFLQNLVPEVRIEIGHGQMEEKALEEVMIRFFHRQFDLLLCTTIIESGIDIPTVNTILIHQAEKFGLAQIYQLRGRVGRGSHRAYAYLLVSEDKILSPESTERLAVLQRFSELGSGYRMASYDLEIRGAGNLLGANQSGHMAAIGYDLYTELLQKAVRELKGEEVLDEIDPELHFRIPSFLPEDYVPEAPLRLELYRRLASLDEEEEVDPIEDELRDRFGTPPPEVENLLELSGLKALAKKLRLKQIRYDGRNFVYSFDPSSPLSPELLAERIRKDPKHCRLTPDLRFIVAKPLAVEKPALTEAKRFLRELVLHLTNFQTAGLPQQGSGSP